MVLVWFGSKTLKQELGCFRLFQI